jgi:release factor glutamine methyltransferase
VDVSNAALDVATNNAASILPERRQSQITALHGDWYSPISRQRFNVIVANPPYVAEGDPHLMQGDLRFEPSLALEGGADGMAALRRIISDASNYLESGGWLLCEHGFDQSETVQGLFKGAGFSNILGAKDLASLDRISGGCWIGP